MATMCVQVMMAVIIGCSLLVSVAYSQDQTITFSHNSFPQNPLPAGLQYRGDAHVQSGNQYLRLTRTNSTGSPTAWSAGQVVHGSWAQFWNGGRQVSFDTTFVFSIKNSSRGAADGIAFFFGQVNTVRARGGNMGVFNSGGLARHTLVVEFDTFSNPEWDPEGRHIGIGIGSRRSNVTAPFDSGTGERVTARIQYDAVTKVITVTAASASQTATLTLTRDLLPILQWPARFGISSATGGQVEELGIHDIHSWSFNSTLPPGSPRNDDDEESDIVDDATNNVVADATSVVGGATNVVDDATNNVVGDAVSTILS